ncbi:hypothetical protein E2C01_022243 [Portunus trituberculatus]|uniref:Uncharacterized protein n=1 Tax=Portunus trituberculatus TaxID=210409 RepID=A0A5B7E5G9_PORTR|nr:hypothetical protein [Portunus trituberculatus]
MDAASDKVLFLQTPDKCCNVAQDEGEINTFTPFWPGERTLPLRGSNADTGAADHDDNVLNAVVRTP